MEPRMSVVIITQPLTGGIYMIMKLVVASLLVCVSSAALAKECYSQPLYASMSKKGNNSWLVCTGERMISKPTCRKYSNESAATAAYNRACANMGANP